MKYYKDIKLTFVIIVDKINALQVVIAYWHQR